MSRSVLLFSVLLVAACTTVPSSTTTAPRPVITGPQIIPAPASLTIGSGAPFDLSRRTTIVVDGNNAEVTAIAQAFAAIVRPSTGFALAILPAVADTTASNIYLRLATDRAALGEEGYDLTITRGAATLVANRPAGLFRGVQTLRQLLPSDVESDMGVARAVWEIPALSITDQPRYAWRGAMLDVSRHFFTVDEVKQFIDLLALYKFNVLHLGLSNDQGWRIEIKSRPKLTSVGSTTQVGGGAGRILHAAGIPEGWFGTRRSATSPSFPKSTCRATRTRR